MKGGYAFVRGILVCWALILFGQWRFQRQNELLIEQTLVRRGTVEAAFFEREVHSTVALTDIL